MRNLRLDVLRGLAILLVLGRHLPEGTTVMSGLLVHACGFWYKIGWSGVDLFFVLSGFLVSGLLFREYQKEGSIRLGRFLMRRTLRIWPAFYVMTFITLALVFRTVSPMQIMSELFFLQSYIPHIWKHTWTLAVEEHFYLFLGILLLFLSKQKKADPFGLLQWVWAAAAVGCLFLRLDIPYGDMWPFARTHLRIDGLLFGVLLSYYYCFHGEKLGRWVRARRWVLAASAVIVLSPIFFLHLGVEPFIPRFGLTCTYLGYGLILLLVVCAKGPASGNILQKIMAWIGVRSYSIYLWHLPVCFFIAQPLSRSVGGVAGLWLAIGVYLASSIIAGWISYRWIERPVLEWRDRYV